MPVLTLVDLGGYLALDPVECKRVGSAHRSSFHDAEPFPHLVLDDFLDANVLRTISRSLPAAENAAVIHSVHHQLKRTWHPQLCACAVTRNLFAELNSQAFLDFLSAATGVEFLIPDPYFDGSGLHEVLPGGRLGIHQDRNLHAGMKVHRRVNLLIYLNTDWRDEYGGHLELWDRQVRQQLKTIAPLFGRAVIFATDQGSFHGHPDPLNCPPGTSRISLSQYYYSSEAHLPALRSRPGALYVPRKGSSDKYDWHTRLKQLVIDIVPPFAYRTVRRFYRRARPSQHIRDRSRL